MAELMAPVDDVLGNEWTDMVVGAKPGTAIRVRRLTQFQHAVLRKMRCEDEQDRAEQELFMSVQRGGFEGTFEEFMKLLEGDDFARASAELEKLYPFTMEQSQARADARVKADPAVVETMLRVWKELHPELAPVSASPELSGESSEPPA